MPEYQVRRRAFYTFLGGRPMFGDLCARFTFFLEARRFFFERERPPFAAIQRGQMRAVSGCSGHFGASFMPT
jgi:hypothetical protein